MTAKASEIRVIVTPSAAIASFIALITSGTEPMAQSLPTALVFAGLATGCLGVAEVDRR
ncbi:hypothetical protein [Mycobacterium leprae]|nr:hypothetical protein [Mycobacterium leprae]